MIEEMEKRSDVVRQYRFLISGNNIPNPGGISVTLKAEYMLHHGPRPSIKVFLTDDARSICPMFRRKMKQHVVKDLASQYPGGKIRISYPDLSYATPKNLISQIKMPAMRRVRGFRIRIPKLARQKNSHIS